jgi:tetratricopeptide (TPR) repeat protein
MLNSAKTNNLNVTPKTHRMNTILEQAVKFHQDGLLADAEKLYKKVRKSDPKNIIALQLLGVIAAEKKDFALSLNFFSRAISLQPSYADAFYNRGNVYKTLQRYNEALSDYQSTIELNPCNFRPYFSRGNIYRELGEFAKAIPDYTQSILLGCDDPEVYCNRAVILEDLGQLDGALSDYDMAVDRSPKNPDILTNRANLLMKMKCYNQAILDFNKLLSDKPQEQAFLNNRGICLRELCKFDLALKDFNSILAISPSNIEALNNRGILLKRMRRPHEALTDLDKALSLDIALCNNDENRPKILSNRGTVYQELNRYDEALSDYNSSLDILPTLPETFNNRGNTHRDLGNFDKASEDFDAAIRLNPNYAEAQWNKALLQLLNFDFHNGWQAYEWRWKRELKDTGNFLKPSKPMWNGERDTRVLIWAEQGIGDEIMFASLISEISETCSHLLVQCDHRLLPIFERSFPNHIKFIDKNLLIDEGKYDYHIPIASLPLHFRPSIKSFKNTPQRYLKHSKSNSEALRESLLKRQKKKLIGISWLTKSTLPGASNRNLNLIELLKNFDKETVRFVSLQYGDVSTEISKMREEDGIDIIEVKDIDNREDIDGLASLMMACDQIISVDNATVHLAGALGVNTKILLPFNNDWRWGKGRRDSLWYNSVTLYRQKFLNDWSHPIFALMTDKMT